jgi:MFS family permease
MRTTTLGLRANWWQFSLFTLITLLIGLTAGVERVTLPPLAHHAFGVTSILYTASFITGFGAIKAPANLLAGRLSDRHGRRGILASGWLLAVPYAVLVILATHWWQVILANAFLGASQALTWTMSVTAKIDLVGPTNRGLAVGIDESAGYIGVGIGGFVGGIIAAHLGLRPAPYLLVIGVVVLGLLVTLGPARETVDFARHEAVHLGQRKGPRSNTQATSAPRLGQLAVYVSWRDPSLRAVSLAGLVNKVADSAMATVLPLLLLARGAHLATVGLVAGVYAWVWGLGQVPGGALADRVGRKIPIVMGTALIAAGLGLLGGIAVAWSWYVSAAVLGLGMALVYPNLITAVSDTVEATWRGGALGVYRLWRDGGYAIGPVVLGVVAGAWGIPASMLVATVLVGASALLLAATLAETHPQRRREPPRWQTNPATIGRRASLYDAGSPAATPPDTRHEPGGQP